MHRSQICFTFLAIIAVLLSTGCIWSMGGTDSHDITIELQPGENHTLECENTELARWKLEIRQGYGHLNILFLDKQGYRDYMKGEKYTYASNLTAFHVENMSMETGSVSPLSHGDFHVVIEYPLNTDEGYEDNEDPITIRFNVKYWD